MCATRDIIALLVPHLPRKIHALLGLMAQPRGSLRLRAAASAQRGIFVLLVQPLQRKRHALRGPLDLQRGFPLQLAVGRVRSAIIAPLPPLPPPPAPWVPFNPAWGVPCVCLALRVLLALQLERLPLVHVQSVLQGYLVVQRLGPQVVLPR